MKILFITLSNIGDVILTFPVFDALHERFPRSKISVVVGPKAKSLFEDNPLIDRLIIFEKRSTLKEKWRWIRELRREKFDLVVDLRNSMMPYLVGGRKATRPAGFLKKIRHKKDEHFRRLKQVVKDAHSSSKRYVLSEAVLALKESLPQLKDINDYVVVSPGAADPRKRWPHGHLAKVITYLVKTCHEKVVMVGDKADDRVADMMFQRLPDGVINLCGQTSLVELAVVLRKAKLALLNDSGIMHLASYMNIPIVALFGPTDPRHYGPWSGRSITIHRGMKMDMIPVEDVTSAVGTFLSHAKLQGDDS
jgi:heptosyltransferase III